MPKHKAAPAVPSPPAKDRPRVLTRRNALRGAAGLLAGGGLALTLTTPVGTGTADSQVVAGHRRAGQPVDRGRLTWGEDEERQTGWLFVPDPAEWSGGEAQPEHPVVVMFHGGSWHDESDPSYLADIAQDLARYGLAVWVPTYRGLDGPGGWPATFQDVSDAIEFVPELADQGRFRPDLSQVHLLGHSAGGHLATWAAGRDKLPPGAPGADATVNARSVTSMAGLYDLVLAENLDGGDLVRSLMGGVTPEDDPQRYDLASPIDRLPLEIPINALHGLADDVIPVEAVQGFLDELRATGNPGIVELLPGVGHGDWSDVFGWPWARARLALLDCVGGP
ncbi:alpha/beta hydrolase [Kocuria coralli]|uniref:Alpha/beta hydrolase n=1 Tax=Kocuria coralli TaxID=1461025 RepID=A0A5J5KVR3_9MICC|nr:alpha/beta hydrolase [Kocuria coralli]KAA9392986.1 alpha/beta hydrolase [Kocuria coralli]